MHITRCLRCTSRENKVAGCITGGGAALQKDCASDRRVRKTDTTDYLNATSTNTGAHRASNVNTSSSHATVTNGNRDTTTGARATVSGTDKHITTKVASTTADTDCTAHSTGLGGFDVSTLD